MSFNRILIVAAALVAAVTAQAHHSFAVEFLEDFLADEEGV